MHMTTTCVEDVDATGWRRVSMCVYTTDQDHDTVVTVLKNFLRGLEDAGAVDIPDDAILVRSTEDGGLSGATTVRWRSGPPPVLN